MDGGTVWDVNVISAIEQCLEVVDDVSKIVIDIAICSGAPKEGIDLTKTLQTTISEPSCCAAPPMA